MKIKKIIAKRELEVIGGNPQVFQDRRRAGSAGGDPGNLRIPRGRDAVQEAGWGAGDDRRGDGGGPRRSGASALKRATKASFFGAFRLREMLSPLNCRFQDKNGVMHKKGGSDSQPQGGVWSAPIARSLSMDEATAKPR